MYRQCELELIYAIQDGELEKIRPLYSKHPELASDLDSCGSPRLCEFVRAERDDIFELGLTLGWQVNAVGVPPNRGQTALVLAIHKNRMNRVRRLLEVGADPNLGRPVIACLHDEVPPDQQLEYLRLFVKYGADLNRLYDIYGDDTNSFSALDWAPNEPVRQFLIEHGALPSKEIKKRLASGQTLSPQRPPSSTPLSSTSETISKQDQIIQFCTKNFGPVARRSIQEIVPSDLPITIHIVPPSPERQVLTLFTTGMSDRPMQTPVQSGSSALAELYIQLPPSWRYTEFKNPRWSWPLIWLRKLAKYPASEGCWLESPVTFISIPDKQSVAPGLNYTAFMLFADKDISLDTGETICLYRVFPLFEQEMKLVKRDGIPGLMRAFDKHKVSFIYDPNRTNVGVS